MLLKYIIVYYGIILYIMICYSILQPIMVRYSISSYVMWVQSLGPLRVHRIGGLGALEFAHPATWSTRALATQLYGSFPKQGVLVPVWGSR